MRPAVFLDRDVTINVEKDYIYRCRKHAPGMIFRAARNMDIVLANSWIVGYKLIDISAVKAVGIASVMVRTGYGAAEEHEAPEETSVVDYISQAVELILSTDIFGGLCLA